MFPKFFDIFLENSDELNAPEPTNGDTVLHIAYKKEKFNELLAMLEHNGNPFLKNKKGESIENYLKVEFSSNEILKKIKEKVETLKKETKDALKKTSTGVVHQATIERNLNKLRFYYFFSISLETFNGNGVIPLELALDSNDLEIVLFIVNSTKNIFENTSLAPGVNFVNIFSSLFHTKVLLRSFNYLNFGFVFF